MVITKVSIMVGKIITRVMDIIMLTLTNIRRLPSFERRTILFFPEKPRFGSVIYKICYLLDYHITTNKKERYDLVMVWQDKTFRDSIYCNISKLFHGKKVINVRCDDVSKENVEKVFTSVFGYSSFIDPIKYHGLCVRKSNINAKHDGKIIQCPIKRFDSGFVYMKLLNNKVNDLVMDIRLPVFLERLPFVYLKYRSVYNRFSNINLFVKIAEVREYLSEREIKQILLFCKKIGLDLGELDIIRDKDDGKLYIIDVASTPYGPPNHLPVKKRYEAIEKMSLEFTGIF